MTLTRFLHGDETPAELERARIWQRKGGSMDDKRSGDPVEVGDTSSDTGTAGRLFGYFVLAAIAVVAVTLIVVGLIALVEWAI